MGSAESKPAFSYASSDCSSSSSDAAAAAAAAAAVSSDSAEDLGPYLSSLSLSGIRLHQVDSRNYLGRLQDAEKFSQPNGATQVMRSLLLRLLLWRRERENASNAWRTRLIEQQEQRILKAQKRHLQIPSATAPTVASPAATPSNTSGSDGFGESSATSKAASISEEAVSKDLTTLLRRGFDPAAYNKRQQLARFSQPEKFGLNPREV
ncbi:hypothetical protein BOX15_Mlig025277g1 [Macrostomum lignano]|uniref:Uncharacterized protein n=1 Tax=Macrostomum lignano TaxID=282301 RepID=A0A267DQ09_9PLAT|nr:hypothetical protein BOX15_Mlig025277g1 [Macrostomum lignano]